MKTQALSKTKIANTTSNFINPNHVTLSKSHQHYLRLAFRPLHVYVPTRGATTRPKSKQ